MPVLLKFEREALCGLHLIGVSRNGKKSSTSRFKAVDQGRCPRVESAFEGQDACRQSFEGDEADGWGAAPQGRDVGHRTWPSSVSVLGSRRTPLMRVSGVPSERCVITDLRAAAGLGGKSALVLAADGHGWAGSRLKICILQPPCRFRFQYGTGGLKEFKALPEMSPTTFSVSVETE